MDQPDTLDPETLKPSKPMAAGLCTCWNVTPRDFVSQVPMPVERVVEKVVYKDVPIEKVIHKP